MEPIELQLDEQTLERARRLAASRRFTLEELITTLLQREEAIDSENDPVLGMFAHEPELIDQVAESAMQMREQHILRASVEYIISDIFALCERENVRYDTRVCL